MSIVRLALVLLAVGVASCTKMVQSTPGADAFVSTGATCSSSLGAYRLPKKLLHVKISPDPAKGSITFEDTSFEAKTVGDPKFSYCLDFLGSVTSEDAITVKRGAGGLLESITSNATDRTPEIAAKLADTAANVALIAARSGLMATPTHPVTLDFDPFDPEDLATANEALYAYGYCVFVSGTIQRPEHWCGLRRKPRLRDPVYEAAQLPPSAEAARTEVLYRANQTYDVHVMRKADPRHDGWRLYMTRAMEMPNRSPIFGIGVERAMFTYRKTALAFSQGVLTDVTIDKGSEALGFASIPLYLAQTVVKIPTQIVQLKINMANDRAKLIEAQGQLIAAWTQYYRTMGYSADDAGLLGAVSGNRSGRIGGILGANAQDRRVLNCLDAGTAAQCAELLRSGKLP